GLAGRSYRARRARDRAAFRSRSARLAHPARLRPPLETSTQRFGGTMRSPGRLLALAFTIILVGGNALAQSGRYRTKPIRLIVPFAPGGGTDIVARTMAQTMSDALGQSVIVDNRPGAGGTVGAETLVRAQPDGYTLAMVSGSYATNAAVYKLAFDAVNDIEPISIIGESAFVLVVHPSVPANSVQELISIATSKACELKYGSTGTGGITHLASELFDLLAGTRMTHVPYKGTGPSLTALLGNQI